MSETVGTYTTNPTVKITAAVRTPTPLDWQGLARHAATPFPSGWDPNRWVFFSPRDPGVHNAILEIVQSCSHSFLGNEYGWDDDEISIAELAIAADPNIAFIQNLDSSQASGKHEKALLANWQSYIGTSVAIGRSIKHAISHLKVRIIDGEIVVSGSTNLSASGETLQDNECVVCRDPLLAARYSAVILLNHSSMLQQMRKAAGSPTHP